MRLIDADALSDASCSGGVCAECDDMYGGNNVVTNCSEVRFRFLKLIKDAPTIEASKPEWISGDTLPDESGLYIVTEKWGYMLEVTTRYFNKRRDGGSFWSGYPYQKVDAWMPLPRPYEGGKV